MKNFLFILTLFIFTSGCWNYQELSKYAIVTGMVIDIKDDEYIVSVLVSNTEKLNDSKSEISILTGKGTTVFSALNDANLKSPKELYINHLSVVLVSENLARNGISDVLDYLLRNKQEHQNFYILIVKDSLVDDELTIISPLAEYSDRNVKLIIENSKQLKGKINKGNFNELIKDYIEPGINIMLSSIFIENEVVSKLDTFGLFKNDKLVDWASKEESIGINLLTNNISYFYINTPCNGGYATTVIDHYKVDYIVEKSRIIINTFTEGYLSEITCNINLNNKNSLKNLEQATGNEIEQYMFLAISKAKNLKTDTFGFGKMIYKEYPTYFKSIENWNEEFINLKFEININFKYKNTESIGQSLEEFVK
jgi:germination protein, Ger(x)C family